MLVYLTPYQELPTVDERGAPFDPALPTDCSDGPTASFRVTSLVGGSQNAEGDSMVDFPPGVAMRVPGNAVLLVNAHYVNASAEAIEPEVRVNLHSVPDSEVETEGGLLFWYDLFVRVDAHGSGRATMSCPLSKAVRLGNAQSHMHARGVDYQAALLAPDGTRTPIYDNDSWSNVPVKTWADGLEIPAQSRIEFPVRLPEQRRRHGVAGRPLHRRDVHVPRLVLACRHCDLAVLQRRRGAVRDELHRRRLGGRWRQRLRGDTGVPADRAAGARRPHACGHRLRARRKTGVGGACV